MHKASAETDPHVAIVVAMATICYPFETSQLHHYETLLTALQYHRQTAESRGRHRQREIIYEAEYQLAEFINDRGHDTKIGTQGHGPRPNHKSEIRNHKFPAHVAAELSRARESHGKISGYHDAYGRILEELDEFWDEVRAKDHARNKENSLRELIQIATMAQRAAEDLNLL